MTTIARLPLADRHVPQVTVEDTSTTSPRLSTSKAASTASTSTTLLKRPRSPEFGTPRFKPTHKRPKNSTTQEDPQVEKEKRRVDRHEMNELFRVKYTKAFPSWTFYFDTTDAEKESLAGRVLQLNGVREIMLQSKSAHGHRHAACGEVLLQRCHALHHEPCCTCC